VQSHDVSKFATRISLSCRIAYRNLTNGQVLRSLAVTSPRASAFTSTANPPIVGTVASGEMDHARALAGRRAAYVSTNGYRNREKSKRTPTVHAAGAIARVNVCWGGAFIMNPIAVWIVCIQRHHDSVTGKPRPIRGVRRLDKTIPNRDGSL